MRKGERFGRASRRRDALRRPAPFPSRKGKQCQAVQGRMCWEKQTMSYSFRPDRMYRMPTHFGPSLGPRQKPDGTRWDGQDSPRATRVWASFLGDADALAALLPPDFRLDGRPVVTVEATCLTEIDWLAGRGYNTLGVRIPATYRGAEEEVSGSFLAVLWENRADPIITGREELGFAKVYAELSPFALAEDNRRVDCGAAWDGFRFLDLTVRELSVEPVADPGILPPPLLHFKYLPRTSERGVADACYATLTPAETPHRRILRRWSGQGTVQFHRATWEQLPTLVNVVNALADLPVREYVAAGMVESIGGKDLGDQRIIR